MIEVDIDLHSDLTKYSPEQIDDWISTHRTKTLNVDDMESEERGIYELQTAVVRYKMFLTLGEYDLTPPVTPQRIREGKIESR